MIEINLQNFETEVITASMNVPVLLDFWSPRSGPCQTLVPLLVQLKTEYQGRFTLAKVNVDAQPQITHAFNVSNVPTCILMSGGKPVDGFAGAQNAEQIKAFLDQHLPAEIISAGESEAELAQALLAGGNTQAALQKLSEILLVDPTNDAVRYDYTRLLIELGEHQAAKEALAPKLAEVPRALRFEALAQWLAAIEYINNSAYVNWNEAQFDQKIALDKRDFETRLAKARWLMTLGEWVSAMDELLEIIMRDKNWGEQAPRKTMVVILELLTPNKPKAKVPAPDQSTAAIELSGKSTTEQDPQAALVSNYRRRLSMLLN